MGEFKLSDVIIEQIKDFNHRNLTKEQKSLIDKLILNEELKKRYKENGGFGTVFKAIWKDGPICNYYNHQWKRSNNEKIALKCLHNSRSMTAQFLKEIELHNLPYETGWIVQCFGITKDPIIQKQKIL
ncbi:uncharacterized protein OCT59_007662 [Rhizophagus irregularis]|uniref:uncharacterized protein n=1 Tax=Rhizophagus irregularis TaxID=588596 RepID=UPI00332DBA42|nr:hypothetical protein OCT59_007662 [Rhizophagus irregularis]